MIDSNELKEQEQKKYALKSQLQAEGIPLETWGQGKARTFDEFFQEVENGESVLMKGERGELMREVNIVNVVVKYKDATGDYILTEDYQVFPDGRQRSRKLAGSVNEKMLPGETPETAAERALKKELGLESNIALKQITQSQETRISPSYPGVLSKFNNTVFECYLTPDQYHPDGYVEYRDDWQNFFRWEKLT